MLGMLGDQQKGSADADQQSLLIQMLLKAKSGQDKEQSCGQSSKHRSGRSTPEADKASEEKPEGGQDFDMFSMLSQSGLGG